MDAETLAKAKEELVRRIREFYGDNLLSIIFYGRHLKDPSFPEIDVVVVIGKPYDPVKLNRVADFVEKVRDPIEEKYGYHVSFELYTREEAENFHSGYLDVVVNYEVAYDKGDYFQNLLRDMLNPDKAMDYVKYLSTIEYIPVDREEK
ncbi:nucleotidyltransferase [Thermococcus sp.]|uniref:nucleotidyltransferase n=1 Tax=Thermococcus sp. TaxID=35749 RepID=UPI00261CA1AD|nr:nucleotidyltransferase [Thermococcus sp.]